MTFAGRRAAGVGDLFGAQAVLFQERFAIAVFDESVGEP
jgi:hypothetical protein